MPSPRKNWDERVAAARRLSPPADIDVRASVRRAIEAEIAGVRGQAARRDLWTDVSALTNVVWVRSLVGGGLLAAISFCVVAWESGMELLETARLAGPTLLGF